MMAMAMVMGKVRKLHAYIHAYTPAHPQTYTHTHAHTCAHAHTSTHNYTGEGNAVQPKKKKKLRRSKKNKTNRWVIAVAVCFETVPASRSASASPLPAPHRTNLRTHLYGPMRASGIFSTNLRSNPLGLLFSAAL